MKVTHMAEDPEQRDTDAWLALGGATLPTLVGSKLAPCATGTTTRLDETSRSLYMWAPGPLGPCLAVWAGTDTPEGQMPSCDSGKEGCCGFLTSAVIDESDGKPMTAEQAQLVAAGFLGFYLNGEK